MNRSRIGNVFVWLVLIVAGLFMSIPLVYAVNGTKSSNGNPYLIPALPKGTVLLRMGRAAAEKDVSTGSYYQLPSPTEQYCQRYIMQVEQTIYDRFSKTEVDWSFTRMERMAMEDMRIGMEASGLFGVKSKHQFNAQGNIYTCEGIWYRAGKDLELGHWEKVLDADTEAVVSHAKTVGEFFHRPISELQSKLLLTGSAEDEMFPKGHYEKLFHNICSQTTFAESYIFEHGGHPAMMSNMEEFVSMCKEFFD